MHFPEICRALDCTEFNRGKDFIKVDVLNVTAGDLMSEVLVFDHKNMVLVSSLNSEQVLRTADMVDAVGVILVNNKKPSQAMKVLAGDLEMTLLNTVQSMFETCAVLHSLLTGAGNSV